MAIVMGAAIPMAPVIPIKTAAEGQYRNIAFRRAAYHSSAANYNNTGHLVTDGIISTASLAKLIVTDQHGDAPANENPDMAFDGLPGTKWLTFNGTNTTPGSPPPSSAWLQVRLPGSRAQKSVYSYSITSANDAPPRDPRDWRVQGSNNGLEWTTLDTQTGFNWSSVRLDRKVFPLSAPVQYSNYRLQIDSNNGDTMEGNRSRTQLAEFDLLDANGVSILREEAAEFESAWISDTGGQEYVYIDLGVKSSIDKVSLYWGDENYAVKYDIQVSDDAKNWRTVYKEENGKGLEEECSFSETQARYVRLFCRLTSDDFYILSEMEVMGTNTLEYTLDEMPEPDADGTQYLTGGNWKLERVSQVTADGAALSQAYNDDSWLPAVVPGTVLTSHLRAGAIPDPNIADYQLQISDSYFTADFWYRNSFEVPSDKQGRRMWLNFNSINWKADVYFNGQLLKNPDPYPADPTSRPNLQIPNGLPEQQRTIEGSYIRGRFDVTDYVKYGQENHLAVYIQKNDTPGAIVTQTKTPWADGSGGAGKNGGTLGFDNPTIHASVGWDWNQTVRGRNIGIYGDVFVTFSDNAVITDPWAITTFANNNISADKASVSTANVKVRGILENPSDTDQTVTVKGTIRPEDGSGAAIALTDYVRTLTAGEITEYEIADINMTNPKLWWPNTYGDQFLYTAELSVYIGDVLSDKKQFNFGVRQFDYTMDGARNTTAAKLNIFCNGVRIVCRGGNWGMDDANLAATPADYDVKVRMHAEANLTMIRNWVGMTNHDAFYEACDRYGVLIFDDFWLANPGDHGGFPTPKNFEMFKKNAEDKVRRVRKHAALALYCGRNEGMPPVPTASRSGDPDYNSYFLSITARGNGLEYGGNSINDLPDNRPWTTPGTLDWTRFYIPHSADNGSFAEDHGAKGVAGVGGWGPHSLIDPRGYFGRNVSKLHSELGLINIPAYESMMEMLTEEYAWPINQVWGTHDFCDNSAQRADQWVQKMDRWFGAPDSLRDFVRKSQMMNYENHKAPFENDSLRRSNGTLLWMSQSSWPSMVWQTYDYYYDTNGGFFGTKKGNQPLNAFWVNGTDRIVLSNSTPLGENLTVKLYVYDLNGVLLHTDQAVVTSLSDTAQDVLKVPAFPNATDIRFIKTEVYRTDDLDNRIADNFYWTNEREYMNLHALDRLEQVELGLTYTKLSSVGGNDRYSVTIENETDIPALMIRLKTLDKDGNRILPIYYSDNYISLMPGDSQTITLEIDSRYSDETTPAFYLEGWNMDEKKMAVVRPRSGHSYSHPLRYQDWEEGMLTGNGTMGALVFGDPTNDTIIYNHRLFNLAATTSRPTRTYNNMNEHTATFKGQTYTDLPKAIKQALLEEDYDLANYLANQHAWDNGGEGNTHPGYLMNINLPKKGEIKDYVRVTDFTTGEVLVNWNDDRGEWTRSTFVSREDNVIVQYLTKPDGDGELLDCDISIGTHAAMGFPGGTVFTQNNEIIDGKTNEAFLNMRVTYANTGGQAGYEGVTRVVANGGTIGFNKNKDVLTVSGADSVVMITRLDKYYDPVWVRNYTGNVEFGEMYTKGLNAPQRWELEEIQEALLEIDTDFDTLLDGQRRTHGEMFNRVTLDLNGSEQDRAESNERLLARQSISSKPILALYERLFDVGRYLYLCSAGDLGGPSLVGIWGGNCSAGWGGTYHLDANYNLQLSGAIIGNLLETKEGYFFLNESWKAGFKDIAENLTGTRGMVAGGNVPNWTSGLISTITSPAYPYQYATGEMGWLLQPFWEYYEVTGDTDFLRERMYPLIREMGDFYEDFLTHTDDNGNYIFLGSVSPETQPPGLDREPWTWAPYNETSRSRMSLVNNSTFDIAGAKFSLEKLIEICNILDIDQGEDGVDKWQAILDKMPPYLINNDGALSEWSWKSDKNDLSNANDYGHRHSSHLITAWPLREITLATEDKELYEAALRAAQMKDRNDLGTGHGILHAALNSALLGDSEAVMKRMMQISDSYIYYSGLGTRHDYGGGDRNHQAYAGGTFVTDIAMSLTTVIMESLMYSDANLIELLPATPAEFATGSVDGLLARGGFEVSIDWEDTILQSAAVKSRRGLDLKLRHSNFSQVTVTKKSNNENVIYTRVDKNTIKFATVEGETYLISGIRQDIRMADQREFLRANIDNLHNDRILETTNAPDEIEDNGAYIVTFGDGSMLQMLGMKQNDIIVGINGYLVTDTSKLQSIYDTVPVGGEIVLRVWRQDRYLKITFTKAESNSFLTMPGTIQAERYAEGFGRNGIGLQTCTDPGSGYNIGNLNSDDWTRYDNIYFKEPVTSIRFRVAKGDTSFTNITVRLDNRTTGLLLGVVRVDGQGSAAGMWQSYFDVDFQIDPTVAALIQEGTHSIFLTFSGSVNVNWFSLNSSSSPDEVLYSAEDIRRPDGSLGIIERDYLSFGIGRAERNILNNLHLYSEESRVAFITAFDTAKSVLANETATQAAIDKAESDLFEAMQNLDRQAYQKGDADGNGVVDVKDIIDVRNHIMGTERLTQEQALDAADANSDGIINIFDLLTMRDIILRNRNTR